VTISSRRSSRGWNEEPTDEEINKVASLAELCLRPKGDESPTINEASRVYVAARSKSSWHPLACHKYACLVSNVLSPLFFLSAFLSAL
jgi:hypothetical protein